MHDKELYILLNRVLQKYPELGEYKFRIKYNHLSDAYALFMIDHKEIYIEVDYDLKDEKESLKVGAIASEVSHIIKEKKLSLIPLGLGSYIEGLIYDRLKIYKNYDERQTDIETVRRGFGKELLELLIYDNENGESVEDSVEDNVEDEKEGLSISQLKMIMKKKV